MAALLGIAALNFFTYDVFDDPWFAMALVAAAWALGEAARSRRVAIGEETRRAVADEQARIARELHDVVAHSVSVIVVQAAAADDVFEERPDQARAALRAIEGSGREALAELRRLLAAVRPGADDDPDRAPAGPRPSSTTSPRRCGRAGSTSCFTARATRPTLPAGVDLSALPHRPGGADEHAPPRPRHARRGDRELRPGGGRARGPRRRPRGGRRGRARPADRGWSGCASARRCSAERSRPVRCPTGGYRVHARLPLEAAP